MIAIVFSGLTLFLRSNCSRMQTFYHKCHLAKSASTLWPVAGASSHQGVPWIVDYPKSMNNLYLVSKLRISTTLTLTLFKY